MAREYTDPKRASDPYALPDIEVWQDIIAEYDCPRCGVTEIPAEHADHAYCPSCDGELGTVAETKRKGWFYWYGFPGCLPDSDAQGPFKTRAAALRDARDGMED